MICFLQRLRSTTTTSSQTTPTHDNNAQPHRLATALSLALLPPRSCLAPSLGHHASTNNTRPRQELRRPRQQHKQHPPTTSQPPQLDHYERYVCLPLATQPYDNNDNYSIHNPTEVTTACDQASHSTSFTSTTTCLRHDRIQLRPRCTPTQTMTERQLPAGTHRRQPPLTTITATRHTVTHTFNDIHSTHKVSLGSV